MTRENILSGFRKTSIYPYNIEIFSDDEYLTSSITDRPNPVSNSEVTVQEFLEKPLESTSQVSCGMSETKLRSHNHSEIDQNKNRADKVAIISNGNNVTLGEFFNSCSSQ